MQKFENWETAKPLGTNKKLPSGGYVVLIKNAIVEERYDKQFLTLDFDIAEGEYRGFYLSQFENSVLDDKKYKGVHRILLPEADASEDDRALRGFKTFIACVEGSNDGYNFDFDERKLRGKYVGGVFGEKEYDFNGKQGTFTLLRYFITADDARKGNYKTPELWRLEKKEEALEQVNDETLPF